MLKESLRRLAQEIVGELVDAGVDAVAQKVRDIRDPRAPVQVSSESVAEVQRPAAPVVRLSRGRCKRCGSALFYARSAIVPGMIYECRSCGDLSVVPVAEAANREGIPL